MSSTEFSDANWSNFNGTKYEMDQTQFKTQLAGSLNSIPLAIVLDFQKNGATTEILMEWAEATKSRIYNFGPEPQVRTYNDLTGTWTNDWHKGGCREFLVSELTFWADKLDRKFKSWKGLTSNLKKNINARRYTLIEWDIAERTAFTRAMKSRKTTAPKTKQSREAQNAKRRAVTALKRARKQALRNWSKVSDHVQSGTYLTDWEVDDVQWWESNFQNLEHTETEPKPVKSEADLAAAIAEGLENHNICEKMRKRARRKALKKRKHTRFIKHNISNLTEKQLSEIFDAMSIHLSS